MSTAVDKPVRHILTISVDKDSSALAVFVKDKVSDMEFVVCNTENEILRSRRTGRVGMECRGRCGRMTSSRSPPCSYRRMRGMTI